MDIKILMEDVDFYIRTRFKEIRQSCSMTQQQMAKELGMKFRGYQDYETGARRPSSKTIVSFCKITNTTIQDFFKDF